MLKISFSLHIKQIPSRFTKTDIFDLFLLNLILPRTYLAILILTKSFRQRKTRTQLLLLLLTFLTIVKTRTRRKFCPSLGYHLDQLQRRNKFRIYHVYDLLSSLICSSQLLLTRSSTVFQTQIYHLLRVLSNPVQLLLVFFSILLIYFSNRSRKSVPLAFFLSRKSTFVQILIHQQLSYILLVLFVWPSLLIRNRRRSLFFSQKPMPLALSHNCSRLNQSIYLLLLILTKIVPRPRRNCLFIIEPGSQPKIWLLLNQRRTHQTSRQDSILLRRQIVIVARRIVVILMQSPLGMTKLHYN